MVEDKAQDDLPLIDQVQLNYEKDGNQKESLYRFVGHQSKTSMRKSLALVI